MTSRARIPLFAAVAVLTVAAAVAAVQDAAKYKLKPGATGKACLSCHVDFADTVALPHVHTPVKNGSCADCHDPHASDHGKLLSAEPSAICVECHADILPADAVSTHRAVVEGQCVKCHDPHASKNENGLRLAGNALCLDCHNELAAAIGGAAHKHAPVEQNCLGCHSPHASTKAPALLAQAVPTLCVKCHDPKSASFTRDHMGYAVGGSDCTSCHDPHGSSNNGILWASLHVPVERRMCGQCHAPPGAAEGFAPKRPGAALCRGCHSEMYNETFAKARVHWPVLDARGCANCHNPHASKTAALLSAPEGELCGSCHRDAVGRQAKSATKHPPVAEGECTTCHAPHASDSTYLLAGEQNELCGACHDWSKHSAHPMGPEAVDQRNKNLTVDCLSCHRTHGTPFAKLTHYDNKQELCMQCHTEFSR